MYEDILMKGVKAGNLKKSKMQNSRVEDSYQPAYPETNKSLWLLFQHPDLSDIALPWPQRKFQGYYKIARHYKWALQQIFHKLKYEAVIVVEGEKRQKKTRSYCYLRL